MTSIQSSLLDVRGLTAGYGNKTVVRDVSFRVPPSRVLTLLGHNGCGKTTTLKSTIGLNPKATGEVWLDGERVDTQPVRVRVGKGLRLLPDSRGIFGALTVKENLDVVADRNCRGPNTRIGVKDVLELFPMLADRMGTTAGSLSGGQQKMLALGLAILGSPRAFCWMSLPSDWRRTWWNGYSC
jgi:branched-chain amino acid transport system ATP-binding protein